MTIYKLINPDKVIIIVVAPNFYEAIQQRPKKQIIINLPKVNTQF